MQILNKLINWFSGKREDAGYEKGDPTYTKDENEPTLDSGGISIDIPVSDIVELVKNKGRTNCSIPDITQFERDRLNKIDEDVDKVMAEVCNENPEMRKRIK